MRTADVLFASGDYGVAMKEYGKVVAAKGVERECVLSARMQVVRCLARLREYAKARDAYESLVKSVELAKPVEYLRLSAERVERRF